MSNILANQLRADASRLEAILDANPAFGAGFTGPRRAVIADARDVADVLDSGRDILDGEYLADTLAIWIRDFADIPHNPPAAEHGHPERYEVADLPAGSILSGRDGEPCRIAAPRADLLDAFRFYRVNRANRSRYAPYHGNMGAGTHALDCLRLARADVAAYDAAMAEGDTSKASRFRRYASSPWVKRAGLNAGGSPSDSVRWIEKPAHVGLRFVGYADKIVTRLDHTGWYTDPDGHGQMRGCVYQLPGRNGVARFVAAHDNQDNADAEDGGPARVDFGTIYESKSRLNACHVEPHHSKAALDAAYAADSLAEREAETERDYQTAWAAGSLWNTYREEVADARKDALELLASRRAIRADLSKAGIATDGPAWASACGAIRAGVRAALASIESTRAKMHKLAQGDHYQLGFYPSDELRAAFNDGAGRDAI